MNKKFLRIFLLLCAVSFIGCEDSDSDKILVKETESEQQISADMTEIVVETENLTEKTDIVLQPYANLKELGLDDSVSGLIVSKDIFIEEDIYTYTWDCAVFEDAENTQEKVLEAGKNPGLGVRELHAGGITGEGVNVAIIDQNLLLDHPEYTENVAAYYEAVGEDLKGVEVVGSMHAPAVMSILAGETIGVAPDAKVYFAGVVSGERDATYFAECLNWVVEQNQNLPEDEKIKVVSISAAPEEGWFENFELYNEAVLKAQEEGILVLDCRTNVVDTGIVWGGNYDVKNPEDVTAFEVGFPNGGGDYTSDEWDRYIFAPANYRTRACAYLEGQYYYGYDGWGGQSWAVPYVAGVLALGWQVNPDLDADTMKDLLYESCYVNENGNHIINPQAFIALVQESL